jgi:hypothetical protein
LTIKLTLRSESFYFHLALAVAYLCISSCFAKSANSCFSQRQFATCSCPSNIFSFQITSFEFHSKAILGSAYFFPPNLRNNDFERSKPIFPISGADFYTNRLQPFSRRGCAL